MGKSIENKVVSLELDDSKFTSRVDGVLHNVDRLKSGMNFKQSTDGLDNVGKAAQDASKQMGGIADGVNNINTSVVNNSTTAAAATANVGAAAKISSTNFSMLAGAASVAMGNIASKALMAGGSVLSSFTFGPILDGFREYENQLNAVQTIQANTFSKGETTATINAALDELNAYADRTIYSFTEMTRNIGMFTSAGVNLKDSVAAIKGLSNVAAMSGSTSEQAATAMYQLSQALSTGSVKLQDWNSIVNAGMGGEQFQEALKRTARTYGVEVDKMIDKAGSFRNSLKDGWLTSEIMIETLTQYTGDLSREQLLSAGYTEQQADEIMKLAETANDAATKVKTFSQLIDTTAEALGSGWASVFRTIFGDFERARTMWTAVSDVVNGGIGTFFDAIQGILDRWDELGGWEEWWYGLGELWTAIAKPLKAIGEGFFSAFQGDAGKALYDFSYYFRHSISQWLMMSDDFANNLGKVFKMAGELLSPVLEVLIGFASAIAQIGVAASKIGMILAGLAIGEHGFNILARDSSFQLFGKVGLYYIMFLAGLEMNMGDFKETRNKALVLGLLAFIVPIGIGFVANVSYLKYGVITSVLLASMYASHTLVAYPIVTRFGISRHRSVSIAVGGTAVTDTLTLLVLAVIGGLFKGETGGLFWIWLVVKVIFLGALIIYFFPRIGRWFFHRYNDNVMQFIFVLAMVFLGAGLMELVGMEGILGAFLAGLVLNRLIPHVSPLMDHLEFVGNALFIPYFLIGVGMLINLRVIFGHGDALKVAAVMITMALTGKWIACWLTQKIYKMSVLERNLMYGLSNAQAAATLAAVLVGYNIILPTGERLLNDDVLNGTVLLILVTCVVSSLITERTARKMAMDD